MLCTFCLLDFPEDQLTNGICTPCSALVSTCGLCNTNGLTFLFRAVRGREGAIVNVCGRCSEQLVRCGDCGNSHLAEAVTYRRLIHRTCCDVCYRRRIGLCDECKTEYPIDGNRNPYVGERNLCKSCFNKTYFLCSSCNTLHKLSEPHGKFPGYFICRKCDYSKKGICLVCKDEHALNLLAQYTTFEGESGRICFNCRDILSRPIQRYSFNPHSLLTLGGSEEDFLLGWELEVGNYGMSIKNLKFRNEDVARIVIEKAKGYVYCKSDSSLNAGTGDGFEMVSRPATLEWMKNNHEVISKLLEIRELGMRSAEVPSCGFHIHINKKVFTPFQLYRFLLLFYSNKDFWLYISQRESAEEVERFSSFEHELHSLLLSSIALRDVSKEQNSHGINKIRQQDRGEQHIRYTAVNITSNTVEVRMLRGSLALSVFMKNVEAVAAAISFSKEDRKPEEVTLEFFLKFIVANRREFPHLHMFLKQKYSLSGNVVSDLVVSDKISNGDFD